MYLEERGKDVCNHDVHFCTKACLLPDSFNALQTDSFTLLMASVDRVVYCKDEAWNDLPSV